MDQKTRLGPAALILDLTIKIAGLVERHTCADPCEELSHNEGNRSFICEATQVDKLQMDVLS